MEPMGSSRTKTLLWGNETFLEKTEMMSGGKSDFFKNQMTMCEAVHKVVLCGYVDNGGRSRSKLNPKKTFNPERTLI